MKGDTKYYRDFYYYAPAGFFATRISDGTFLRANSFLIRTLGFNTFNELQSSAKSTDLYSLLKRKSIIDQLIKDGLVSNVELQFTLPNGKIVWCSMSARLCECDDCIEGMIVDITEQRKMEAELAKFKQAQIESLRELPRP